MFRDSSFATFDEQQLAELYVLMEQLFPRSASQQNLGGQAHFVGPQESVAIFVKACRSRS